MKKLNIEKQSVEWKATHAMFIIMNMMFIFMAAGFAMTNIGLCFQHMNEALKIIITLVGYLILAITFGFCVLMLVALHKSIEEDKKKEVENEDSTSRLSK